MVWHGPSKAKEAMIEFPARYARKPFTAVCCFEDLAAAGIVRAALDMGMKIPDDLSISGFGNLSLGEFAALPVTTVDARQTELAQQAVRLLIEMIRTGKSVPARIRVAPQLLVKQTTGPCPQRS
jgi:DNA-binding LacI/PurR family transcriptional regulator